MYQEQDDDCVLKPFEQEDFFERIEPKLRESFPFDEILNCFFKNKFLKNKEKALFFIKQYLQKTDRILIQNQLFLESEDLTQEKQQENLLFLEYALILQSREQFLFLTQNLESIQSLINQEKVLNDKFYLFLGNLLLKVFSSIFQQEEGNYDDVGKLNFIYSLLFKKMISIAERKQSRPDFIPILNCFIQIIEVAFQMSYFYEKRQNHKSCQYLLKTLESQFTKNLPLIYEFLGQLSLFDWIRVHYFYLGFFRFFFQTQLLNGTYEENLIYKVFSEQKGLIKVIFEKLSGLLEVVVLNQIDYDHQDILRVFCFALDLKDDKSYHSQLLNELFIYVQKQQFSMYEEETLFLLYKIRELDFKALSLFTERIIEKLLDSDVSQSVYFQALLYQTLLFHYQIKPKDPVTFQSLIEVLSGSKNEQFNMLLKVLMKLLVNEQQMFFNEVFKILLLIVSPQIKNLSLEGFILLEVVYRKCLSEKSKEYLEMKKELNVKNLALELVLLEICSLKYSSEEFISIMIPETLSKIKEFIFLFGSKIEQKNLDNRKMFFTLKLVSKIMLLYSGVIDTNTKLTNLRTLLKNFCFNAKDFLHENEQFTKYFEIDTSSSVYVNKQKFPFIRDMVITNHVLKKLSQLKKLPYIVNSTNMDSFVMMEHNRSLCFKEIQGIGDPIQVNINAFIHNGKFVVNLIVTNTSGILLKDIVINVQLLSLNNNIKTMEVSIPNLFTQQQKNFFFEIELAFVEGVKLKVWSFIKNVEKVENCIVNPKEEMLNLKIEEEEENDFNFNLNHYMFSENIILPFYYFFMKMQSNIEFNKIISKFCIFKRAYTLSLNEKQSKKDFFAFLDLKGVSEYYHCYMDINLQKFFFVKMTQKTQNVIIKVSTNSQVTSDQLEEIFEEQLKSMALKLVIFVVLLHLLNVSKDFLFACVIKLHVKSSVFIHEDVVNFDCCFLVIEFEYFVESLGQLVLPYKQVMGNSFLRGLHVKRTLLGHTTSPRKTV